MRRALCCMQCRQDRVPVPQPRPEPGAGSGEIREPRLYQLMRQKGPIVDRTFEIEFLDLGVQALAFTFG